MGRRFTLTQMGLHLLSVQEPQGDGQGGNRGPP